MERKKVARAAELEEDALIVEYLRQRQLKEQVRLHVHCAVSCHDKCVCASRCKLVHRYCSQIAVVALSSLFDAVQSVKPI